MSVETREEPAAVLSLPKKLNGVRDLVVLTASGASIVPHIPTAISVDHTGDDTLSACTGAANDCSIRGAVIFANNLFTSTGGDTSITLPAGTYNLTIVGNTNNAGAGEGFSGNVLIGDVDFRGDGTVVLGAGSATTIIRQTTANDRTLEPNPSGLLNWDWTISGVTITGGRDTGGSATGGGGSMLTGSKDNTTTITNSVISNNWANGLGSLGGGGVSTEGGSETFTNDVFGGSTTVAS